MGQNKHTYLYNHNDVKEAEGDFKGMTFMDGPIMSDFQFSLKWYLGIYNSKDGSHSL